MFALQWDVVQLALLLANMLAKSAPYLRQLPPQWFVSFAVKVAPLACAPCCRRW